MLVISRGRVSFLKRVDVLPIQVVTPGQARLLLHCEVTRRAYRRVAQEPERSRQRWDRYARVRSLQRSGSHERPGAVREIVVWTEHQPRVVVVAERSGQFRPPVESVVEMRLVGGKRADSYPCQGSRRYTQADSYIIIGGLAIVVVVKLWLGLNGSRCDQRGESEARCKQANGKAKRRQQPHRVSSALG